MSSPNVRPYLLTPDYRGESGFEKYVARVFNGLSIAVLCLLLAFGPLAFGAVQPWAVCALEVGAALCVVLWALREFVSGKLTLHGGALLLPILLFAALVCLQLLAGLTAYRYATWQTSLLWAAYGMIFFVTLQCLRSRVLLKRAALFFTGLGFVIALFAMVQQFTWNGYLYWVVPNRYGGMVYGPYVNHSHYAGLMEMLVPFPLVFALTKFWQKPVRVLFCFIALIMAGTIFLSRSLGGMLSFGVQMIVLAVILSMRERSKRQILLFLLMIAIFVVWLIMLSPGGISERIALLHEPLGKAGAGDRLAIVKDSLRMLKSRPVLGWGLGTFPEVYPSYRSFYTNFFVNEAHNDYVQLAVETGLLGFAIGCWFITLVYRRALRRLEHWRKDPSAAVALAALVGFTGILVHSLADFNLQIPANATLFFVLAALAAGVPQVHSRADSVR